MGKKCEMRKKKNICKKIYRKIGCFLIVIYQFSIKKFVKEILDKTHFTFSWHKFHFLYSK